MAIIDGKIKCSACGEMKSVTHYQPSIVRAGCGTCRQCKYKQKREYEKSNPEKYNAQVKANRDKRREEYNETQRAWRASRKDRIKESDIWKRYGITIEQYRQMLADQGGGCAICGAEENTNGKALFVDHCHDTGKVRGILCYRCNTGLGSFKDNAVLVAKAVSYLNGSN